jgi:hypothetical protein
MVSAQHGDFIDQMLQRVARQAFSEQVMSLEPTPDPAMQSAAAPEQCHRPADPGIFNRGFCKQHGFDPVICRFKNDR